MGGGGGEQVFCLVFQFHAMILNCKCGWSHMDAYELNGGNLEMQLETNIGSKLPLSTSLLLPVSL